MTVGGLSFFSTRRGWISDNVLSFRVLLASGELVNANARENPDLFTALKGGSNNFGIVTSFELSTFPQGKIWGGDIFYGADIFPQQLQSLVAYVTNPEADPDVHLIISIAYAAMFGATVCKNSV